MTKLPLTNIEKFEKIKFSCGKFETLLEFKEYFYIQNGANCKETLHGCYKHRYEIEEGIQLRWNDNPFNLHFINDNYLILTDKIKNNEES